MTPLAQLFAHNIIHAETNTYKACVALSGAAQAFVASFVFSMMAPPSQCDRRRR